MSLSIVVLAAGKGKRMMSSKPKVLHSLAGRPILEHVLATAESFLGNNITVVVGHAGEQVRSYFSQRQSIRWSTQDKQLGTGHAVSQALPEIEEDDRVLILYGDVPLITKETLSSLIDKTPENAIGVLTANVTNPAGLGRIMRDESGAIMQIVEEKDATVAQKNIHEINTGILLVPAKFLHEWLPQLSADNAQGEYYLTDIIALACQKGVAVVGHCCESEVEVMGVNSREQLAGLERALQERQAYELIRQGVTVMDPKRFDVRGRLECGKETIFDVNVVLEGNVKIGHSCKIGANVVLKDVTLEDGVEVKAFSHIEGAQVRKEAVLGPYARIRPGTEIESQARIGNFVEVKKSKIGQGSKVNHLSYVGDAVIGQGVNVGAGTITCNYDGANKHKTVIEDGVFIGSGVQLVAPITVCEGATVGAGTTLTDNAPAGTLVVGRTKQRAIKHWKRPQKKLERE